MGSKYFNETKVEETLVDNPLTNSTNPLKAGYFDLVNKVGNLINPVTQVVQPVPLFKSDGYENVDVINLRGIRQVYKTNKVENILFENFNFDIKDIKGEGQFVALLGKSGCGKCLSENTLITIKNKKTGFIEDITIKDFLNKIMPE